MEKQQISLPKQLIDNIKLIIENTKLFVDEEDFITQAVVKQIIKYK